MRKITRTDWRLASIPRHTGFHGIWPIMFRLPLFVFRPYCKVFGHVYEIITPYGIKAKWCSRCSHTAYERPIPEEGIDRLYNGEVGELYGVRFQVSSDDDE